jgi:superfamily II DNA/RNA helicase
LCLLRAAGADTGDFDDWDSYAMLHDSEDSDEEEAAQAPMPEARTMGLKDSEPVLEDDPRAVHVPADAMTNDDAILQSTIFGQVTDDTGTDACLPPARNGAACKPSADNLNLPLCMLCVPQMGLSVELCRALADMNINTPTPIQRASLPVSLAGESVLLCAETGSGKSLAFLLPLVARLKNDEHVLGIHARPKRPRALVLAPTRELASQILAVAKGLSRHAKFSSMAALGGSSMAAQAKQLQRPVDLVIATPGRLVDLLKDGLVSLGDVRFVVADEADTMAAQGFATELEKILSTIVAASDAAKKAHKEAADMAAQQLANASSDAERQNVETQLKLVRGPFHPKDRGRVQCVLAAATVATSVQAIIQRTFPKTREIKTELAHKVPEGLFQEFVSVTSGDRALRLLEVLDRGRRMNMQRFAEARALDGAARDATIVFCNTKDSALFAARLLRENDFDIAEGHGWVPQHERQARQTPHRTPRAPNIKPGVFNPCRSP